MLQKISKTKYTQLRKGEINGTIQNLLFLISFQAQKIMYKQEFLVLNFYFTKKKFFFKPNCIFNVNNNFF